VTPIRKRKIDTEITRELAQALAWGCTIEQACASARISDTTCCEGRHCNPAFAEEVDRSQRVAFVVAKTVVFSLYRTEVTDKITDQVTEKLGWDTNERSKSYAIDLLSRDLEDGRCLPHSQGAFDEPGLLTSRPNRTASNAEFLTGLAA
jgi:hypothetical protein